MVQYPLGDVGSQSRSFVSEHSELFVHESPMSGWQANRNAPKTNPQCKDGLEACMGGGNVAARGVKGTPERPSQTPIRSETQDRGWAMNRAA